MHSWKIGKVILLTWKNRFVHSLKANPLFFLIPLLILFGTGFGMWKVYNLVETQLFSGSTGLDTAKAYEYTANYAQISYFITLFGVVTLWQWGVKGKLVNKLLEALPVRKSTWTIGQLLPVLLIMWMFAMAGLLPMLLVLASYLKFSLLLKTGMILLFFLLIVHALLAALFWQQLIHLLTKYLAGKGDEKYHLSIHQIFFFLSAAGIGVLFYASNEQNWGLKKGLPGAFFSEAMIMFHEGSALGLFYAGLIIAAVLLLLAVLLFAFRYESEWRPDEAEGSIPLKSLPFSQIKILNLMISEGKRLARDYETLFYCMLAFSLFAAGGWLLKRYDLLVYGPIYEAAVSYGLPFVFCLFSLTSRGKDQELWIYLNAAGVRKWEYLTGKLFIHLILLPVMTYGLYKICLLAAGLPQSSQGYLVNAALLFLTSYLVGTILPMNKKNPGSQLVNMLMFYSASGALSLLLMLGQPYEPFQGMIAAGYAAFALFLLILVEKKGVKR